MNPVKWLPVGESGEKLVENFPNNVNLIVEKNSINAIKYQGGRVAIGITVSDKPNYGYHYNQNLKQELPIETIKMVELLGARVTQGQILYGKEWVEPRFVLSKLQDMRALAEIVSSSLN